MSDVMSVRLHLSGVRVRGVGVDSVDRLEVEVESAREWSRCRHCGFRCFRVWDRRTKRVRDLGVSGRRTTLVWRRRRFCCGNCGERHLEDHDQFQAGLTRRFARRLVADARVMSIRAVSRHHGVGWHRIMGLVRAEAARVAQRRRARPCRVLLVDETSIRRRHRYVTVVVCGDSGKVLAMIPGRTKGSLSRFFRDQGAWWCRQVEIVVSDGILLVSGCHRAVLAGCSPCVGPLPRCPLVHPRPHPGTAGDAAPRPPAAAPDVRAGPVPKPVSLCYAGPTISQTPTKSISTACSRLIHVFEPRGTRSKSSTSCMRPKASTGPTRPWDGSLTSTPPARSLNTTKLWTPSSPGEQKSSRTTTADGHPTDLSKGSTTSSRFYAASLTGSPIPITLQPEQSS